MLVRSSLLLLLLFPLFASASCYKEAGEHFGVAPKLLQAIARVESAENPHALNRNPTSLDVGLMQVNSSWFPKLAKIGIQPHHLFDPCVNLIVSAWILQQNTLKYGPTWEAVGAFNASCTKLKGDDCRLARQRYITKVRRYYE